MENSVKLRGDWVGRLKLWRCHVRARKGRWRKKDEVDPDVLQIVMRFVVLNSLV